MTVARRLCRRPRPITAPQVPTPDAPPRDLPIQNPPTQPNRETDNPNVVLPDAPLAGVNVPPATGPATGPEGGKIVGSDRGIDVPLPDNASATDAAPLDPDVTLVPSSPETDIASGEEGPDGRFSIEVPDGQLLVYDRTRGLTIAKGPVTFSYREFTVTGDQGIVDYNTQSRPPSPATCKFRRAAKLFRAPA